MNATHQVQIQALENNSYERLFIRRIRSSCWLIIGIDGEDHAFVNKFGEAPDFRHAWQAREWLQERFGIDPESVPLVNAPD